MRLSRPPREEASPLLNIRHRGDSHPLLPSMRGALVADIGDPHHSAKVIRYKSSRLAHWGIIDFRMFSSTLFNSYPVWVKLIGVILLGVGSAVSAAYLCDSSKLDVSALTNVTNLLNGLVAFLLGLYIGKCLDRWWLVVYTCLGTMWEELTGLCMLTGTCFYEDTRQQAATRLRILRYCVLINKMVLRALRTNEDPAFGKDDLRDHDVERFCHVRLNTVCGAGPDQPLLECDEFALLKLAKCRPQVVASWIQAYIAALQMEAHREGTEDDHFFPGWYMTFMDRSENLRRAIGSCERSLSTQLPFSYVHLITSVVLLNNLVLSVTGGLFVASGLQNGAFLACVAEVIFVFTITFVYQSLLELCACLMNPLDTRGFAAIPTAYCTAKLEENMAFCMHNARDMRARFDGGADGAQKTPVREEELSSPCAGSPIETVVWEGRD